MKKLIREAVCKTTPIRTEVSEKIICGKRMHVSHRKYSFGGEMISCDPIRKI